MGCIVSPSSVILYSIYVMKVYDLWTHSHDHYKDCCRWVTHWLQLSEQWQSPSQDPILIISIIHSFYWVYHAFETKICIPLMQRGLFHNKCIHIHRLGWYVVCCALCSIVLHRLWGCMDEVWMMTYGHIYEIGGHWPWLMYSTRLAHQTT